MLKLAKSHALLVCGHERLRCLSTSAAALANQETALNSHTHLQYPLESGVPLFVDPKPFISSLLNCRDIFQIRQVHAQVTVNGLLHNLAVANKLLYV
ncbi:hypothetical protein SLA2020_353080 [Shorea laevis]